MSDWYRQRLNKRIGDKMPPITQRAKSLGRAVGRSAVAALSGQQVVTPPGELAARQKACSTCDREQAGWCGACGCALAAKQRMATETCPLGRWPTAQPPTTQGPSDADRPES